MKRYIAKRIIHSIFIMWMVATTVFFGLRFIPGGPIKTMYGVQATPGTVEELRNKYGFNDPLPEQYAEWLVDLATLKLGPSATTGASVNELLAQAVPRTLSIAVLAVIIGFGVAIPAGIISATRKQEPIDYVATAAAFAGLSMPAFFIGILLSLVFGVWFNLLPVFGYEPLKKGLVPWATHIILPSIAVGLPYAAVIMRMMRSSLLEVLGSQYIKTARAKGVRRRVQLYKHAFQNAMLSVVTIAGIQIALILTGSVTVELVFGINGVGQLLVDSMLNRDYPVVQGVILVVAGIMVFTNLFVDITYTLIDPRIRYGSGTE
jgi:peptide/nickel transport system permease protein